MKKYLTISIVLLIVVSFDCVMLIIRNNVQNKLIATQQEIIENQREEQRAYGHYCDSLIDMHDSLYNELVEDLWNYK